MSFNFSEKEKEVLNFWNKNNIFQKSLEKNKNKGRDFIFYEGPPYANGKPGIHHVVARSFKDAVLRYKTMNGFYVKRKAGWDTHGLPAEIAAEKALGIKTKKEIEKIGVEKFIEICKENVFTYKKEWEEFTERIGYWLDMENPYITCSNEYIESLFFILKQFYKRGLLYKENRVVPWCPRCQTTLAQHEIAQGYQKIKESSIYVKIKIKKPKTKLKRYLLIWTTTPWTLPGNVAVAFSSKIKYVLVKNRKGQEQYILARTKLDSIFQKGDYQIIREVRPNELLKIEYEPPFSKKIDSQKKKRAWKLYSADFVSEDEGTGFVHIAPAFGEDDFNLGKENDLPSLVTVDEEGKMKKGVIGEGKFVKEADKDIIENLKKRKLLFKEEIYEHDYPFCWRCDTPVLYYLHSSWFAATKKIQNKLISNNKKIKWHPGYFKGGRFGNFLEEVRDWNISRERYWGTPLPIWECQNCKNVEVIGSRSEILKKKFSSNRYFLLRHGLAETNIKGILSADPKRKYHLTSKGKEQVMKAAQGIKKLLKDEKIDLIFSSDILRCKETAEIVKKELGFNGKIILTKNLREIGLGEWEGKSMKELKKYLSKNLKEYLSCGLKRGESWNDFKIRALSFIDEIEKKYKNKNILIVSHGDILWSLDSAFKGLSQKEILEAIKRKDGYFNKGEVREVKYAKFPFDEKGELDFHRPYIDEIVFECDKCGGRMKRIKEVCDVWFDSGAMPLAQAHFPFACAQIQNAKMFASQRAAKQNKNQNYKKLIKKIDFPADFICEGIDQTRGWFYTLLAVSSLLGLSSPYKEVLSTGLVMDKFGKKMSKSRGNVVNPWEISQKYGADSMRWYFYTINQPWDIKNFNEDDLKKCFNRFILTLWNCFVFYNTYSNNLKIKFQNLNFQPKSQKLLDKWIISRLQNLILKTKDYFEKYEIVKVAREIENFVIEDFSNWYIRRSRERFQKPKNKKELIEAAEVLGFVLFEISKIIAPFTPFLSEVIYQGIRGDNKVSVHLDDYPGIKKDKINLKLEEKMRHIRGVVALVLAERKNLGIKVRQPLKKLKIKKLKLKIDSELLSLIKEEVNVKNVVFDSKIKKDIELDTKITKELREEGQLREIIRMLQEMRKKGGLTKEDLIEVSYSYKGNIFNLIEKNKNLIKKEIIAKNILKGKNPPYIIEREFSIEGENLWVGIKKIKD